MAFVPIIMAAASMAMAEKQRQDQKKAALAAAGAKNVGGKTGLSDFQPSTGLQHTPGESRDEKAQLSQALMSVGSQAPQQVEQAPVGQPVSQDSSSSLLDIGKYDPIGGAKLPDAAPSMAMGEMSDIQPQKEDPYKRIADVYVGTALDDAAAPQTTDDPEQVAFAQENPSVRWKRTPGAGNSHLVPGLEGAIMNSGAPPETLQDVIPTKDPAFAQQLAETAGRSAQPNTFDTSLTDAQREAAMVDTGGGGWTSKDTSTALQGAGLGMQAWSAMHPTIQGAGMRSIGMPRWNAQNPGVPTIPEYQRRMKGRRPGKGF